MKKIIKSIKILLILLFFILGSSMPKILALTPTELNNEIVSDNEVINEEESNIDEIFEETDNELIEHINGFSNVNEVEVNSFADLEAALDNAIPGDHLVINITNDIKFERYVTVEKDIDLTIQSTSKAKLIGPESDFHLAITVNNFNLKNIIIEGNHEWETEKSNGGIFGILSGEFNIVSCDFINISNTRGSLNLIGQGDVNIINSKFENNIDIFGNSIVTASSSNIINLNLQDVTIQDNDGMGIDMYSPGDLTINNSVISNNTNGSIKYNGNGNVNIDSSFIINNQSFKYSTGGLKLTLNNYLDAKATITNTDIIGNRGGVVFQGKELIIKDSNIKENSQYGGIIFEGEELIIQDSEILENISNSSGGGLVFYGTSLTIKDTEISKNEAVSDGGAISFHGQIANIENTSIIENKSDMFGGALSLSGEYESELNINNCIIEKNSSMYGGGIYIFSGNLIVEKTKFIGNDAIINGGALVAQFRSDVIIESNVTFKNNTAEKAFDTTTIAEHYSFIDNRTTSSSIVGFNAINSYDIGWDMMEYMDLEPLLVIKVPIIFQINASLEGLDGITTKPIKEISGFFIEDYLLELKNEAIDEYHFIKWNSEDIILENNETKDLILKVSSNLINEEIEELVINIEADYSWIVDEALFEEQTWLKNDIANQVSGEWGKNITLRNLKNITNIISNDKINKLIPKGIYLLTNLEKLLLTDGNLNTLPNELTSLTKLTELNIANNNFKQIPEIIFNLPNLTNLNISNNKLVGTLPNNIEKLDNLNIANNQMSGRVPDKFINSENFNNNFFVNTNNQNSLISIDGVSDIEISLDKEVNLLDYISNYLNIPFFEGVQFALISNNEHIKINGTMISTTNNEQATIIVDIANNITLEEATPLLFTINPGKDGGGQGESKTEDEEDEILEEAIDNNENENTNEDIDENTQSDNNQTEDEITINTENNNKIINNKESLSNKSILNENKENPNNETPNNQEIEIINDMEVKSEFVTTSRKKVVLFAKGKKKKNIILPIIILLLIILLIILARYIKKKIDKTKYSHHKD